MSKDRTTPSFGFGMKPWRRQLGTEPFLAIVVTFAVALTAGFVSVVPRVVEHVSDDDLRQELLAADPAQRNIRFDGEARIAGGDSTGPFELVDARGEELFETELPESVRPLIRGDQFVFDSPRFVVSSFPDQEQGPFPTTFHFRYQEGIEDELVLVSGAMPEVAGSTGMFRGRDCPDDPLAVEGFEPSDDVICIVEQVSAYEVALTAITARDMQVELGDRVILTPDPFDRLWRNEGSQILGDRIILDITGIIELSDPGLEFWYGDSALHRPRITENPDFRFVFGAGLMRPDRYRQLLTDVQRVDQRYTWRYFVDPDLITADASEQLAVDLSKVGPDDVDLVTMLVDVIDAHLDQRDLTIALLSTVTSGLMAVAAAAVIVLSLLIAARKRTGTHLIIDRGASRTQVLFSAATTALAIVGPGAALGWIAAWLLLPETDHVIPAAAAVATAAIGAMVITAAGASSLSAGSRAPSSSPLSVAKRGRRVAAELVILTAAVASVLLLRRRVSTTAQDAVTGFDPMLVAAPALMAFASAVVAMRFYGRAMGFLATIASRLRGATGFIGFRRVASQSLAARLPVAVMLIAVGIAVFSGTTRIALSTLQLQQSWQEVGADYRIENLRRGAPLPLELIDEGLGIEPATAAGLESRDLIITSPSGSAIADLLAVDSAYTEVLAESGLPERSLSLVDNLRMGTEQPTDNLIPVLISNDWTLNPKPKVGDTFSTNLALSGPDFVIEGIIDGLTGMDPDRPFIVVDLQALADAFGERATKPTFLLVQGLESTSGTINSALGPAADEVIVTSRHDVLNAIAGDPFSIWTRWMLRIVLALAATFAAVAAASTVAVSAATRARDVALLRTIGLRRSEANLLTVLEQLPALVVATTVGIIAGTGIAWLLEPALSLEDFASDRSQEISRVDITSLLGIALLMLVLMTGAAFAGVIAERRSDSAKILRAGDQ